MFFRNPYAVLFFPYNNKIRTKHFIFIVSITTMDYDDIEWWENQAYFVILTTSIDPFTPPSSDNKGDNAFSNCFGSTGP